MPTWSRMTFDWGHANNLCGRDGGAVVAPDALSDQEANVAHFCGRDLPGYHARVATYNSSVSNPHTH